LATRVQRTLEAPAPKPGEGGRQRADWSELHEGAEEQLGLKLETTKGPVEFSVIDWIERPSAN